MDIATTHQIQVEVRGIDVLALKKLSLVSHALAGRLDYTARKEQEVLVQTLDDLIHQIELATLTS